MNVASLDLGLIYVKKGKYKNNPIERAFITFLVLVPTFIYALYENWVIVEVICSALFAVSFVFVFRYMFFGTKITECSCTYSADYLAVKIQYADGVLTYLNIEKVEYNEKSCELFVYCKREGKPVVIDFYVRNNDDVKLFSKMTGCTVSTI